MNTIPSQDAQPNVAVPPHLCRNCGATLSGHYCSQCGQLADVHVPSTKEIIHEVLEGLTHSDSRLWNTLRCLWLKPGRLTLEFIAGRRVAYLPPFRLYLILSVLFFLVASFTHPHFIVLETTTSGAVPVRASPKDVSCDAINGASSLGFPELNARFVRGCKAWASDNGVGLDHLVFGALPKVFFVILPLVALLHMLLYRRPRHRYAEHLLFFLHNHAFFFSVGILSSAAIVAEQAWPGVTPVSTGVRFLLFLMLIAYTVAAMRRVFQRSWPMTVLRAVALSFIYLMVMSMSMAVVSLYAFLQL